MLIQPKTNSFEKVEYKNSKIHIKSNTFNEKVEQLSLNKKVLLHI